MNNKKKTLLFKTLFSVGHFISLGMNVLLPLNWKTTLREFENNYFNIRV